jgi:two-component system OmpR family response regulator
MRILIVEDEPTLQAQLAEGLGAASYAVDTAGNGVDGHYLGASESYDAVVLDLGLPQVDGITVLRKWRASGRTMPVLILTARDGWHEKVAGIDAGADDYLTKPFHMEELLARLRALIRRAGGHASAELNCGPLTLDTRNHRAHGQWPGADVDQPRIPRARLPDASPYFPQLKEQELLQTECW